MKSLRYDTIISDLDGTLVDSRLDIASSMNLALRDLGLPGIPNETIYGYVGDGVVKLVERCLDLAAAAGPIAEDPAQPEGDRPPARDDSARPGPALADALLRRYLTAYSTHLVDTTRPYPGVAATLARMRFLGLKLAVVTNKPVEPSRRILGELDLLESFDLVLGSDSTVRRKPDPLPVAETIRRLGGVAGRTLLVGDLPQDIQMGKAAGVATCSVAYGFGDRRALAACRPDYLIDRFDELDGIVENPGAAGS